ncbi:hypothetical protein CYMTET_26721 [Cymbomonas tetramitiformis]|uniref:Myb-like domain-containing protein n=1 Tax=Cymbomonas tetramitiformis TaxID=36881 RepID=A0AAE0FRJ0_9CHLO|nr:hypothetical protein CYMTET_26721 [Cymbomonas tetramitiformis]
MKLITFSCTLQEDLCLRVLYKALQQDRKPWVRIPEMAVMLNLFHKTPEACSKRWQRLRAQNPHPENVDLSLDDLRIYAGLRDFQPWDTIVANLSISNVKFSK